MSIPVHEAALIMLNLGQEIGKKRNRGTFEENKIHQVGSSFFTNRSHLEPEKRASSFRNQHIEEYERSVIDNRCASPLKAQIDKVRALLLSDKKEIDQAKEVILKNYIFNFFDRTRGLELNTSLQYLKAHCMNVIKIYENGLAVSLAGQEVMGLDAIPKEIVKMSHFDLIVTYYEYLQRFPKTRI